MMKEKKKTPDNRDKAPGKRCTKVLFFNFIRLPNKRQVRTLSWGIKS